MTINKQYLDLWKDEISVNEQLNFDFDDNMLTTGYGVQPALTISSASVDTITLGSGASGAVGGTYNYGTGQYNYNNITWGGSGAATPTICIAPNTASMPGTIYTSGIGNLTWNDDFTNNHSLSVKGDANFEGDVKIKGKSITEMFEKIEEKLAILRPNEELESKWDELRELRNRYKELEKEIIEKEKMWDILKK